MRLTDGSSRNTGRLQLLSPIPFTGWQDYCGYSDQRLIQVVCRTLGYDSSRTRIVYSSNYTYIRRAKFASQASELAIMHECMIFVISISLTIFFFTLFMRRQL